MKPRQPTQKELAAKVEAFNRRYQVGQQVMLRKDDQTTVNTKTRTAAKVLGGHSAVIWVEGISGCYALDRVTPV